MIFFPPFIETAFKLWSSVEDQKNKKIKKYSER